MRTFLVTLACCLLSMPAVAQTAKAHAIQQDQGFRLHATAGYPAVTAVGVGLKTRGGTEFLAQAGGAALFAALIGTAEVSGSHDYFRRAWGSLHAGLAASLLHTHLFTIDCYEGESCGDFVQTLWLASPRAGLRLRLDPRKRGGAIPYLDLSAGPQVALCRGDCPNGDVLVSAAVSLRGLLDFQPRAQ